MKLVLWLVLACPVLVLACASGDTAPGIAQERESAPVDRVRVGWTFSEVVKLLGEPDYSIGAGVLRVGWKTEGGKWFVPVFERDRVVKIEIKDQP